MAEHRTDALERYRNKRDFSKTREPAGTSQTAGRRPLALRRLDPGSEGSVLDVIDRLATAEGLTAHSLAARMRVEKGASR